MSEAAVLQTMAAPAAASDPSDPYERQAQTFPHPASVVGVLEITVMKDRLHCGVG